MIIKNTALTSGVFDIFCFIRVITLQQVLLLPEQLPQQEPLQQALLLSELLLQVLPLPEQLPQPEPLLLLQQLS